MLGEVGFESLGELAAGQHDPSAAAQAFEADIRAQTDHIPFIRTAGMLLSQAQMIVQLQVRKHADTVPIKVVEDYILNCDKLRTGKLFNPCVCLHGP